MEDWKKFLYGTAKDYYLKDSMSNFVLAKKYLIEKIEEVLLPLKQIDKDLYHIENYSTVRAGNIQIDIFSEFEMPGQNSDMLRISKRNVETEQEELLVKIFLNDSGGKIQFGESSPQEITDDRIDLLLKNLLMDIFQ